MGEESSARVAAVGFQVQVGRLLIRPPSASPTVHAVPMRESSAGAGAALCQWTPAGPTSGMRELTEVPQVRVGYRGPRAGHRSPLAKRRSPGRALRELASSEEG